MAESLSANHMTEGFSGAGRVARRVVAFVLVALACVYGAGVWWFGSHWVPGATVNGVDVSGADDAMVAHAIEELAQSWRGSVTSPGGFELKLTAEDVGLSVDGEAMAAQARRQASSLAWPLLLVNPPAVKVAESAVVDDELLWETVGTAVAAFDEEAIEPTAARVAFDADTGSYVVEPEVAGTRLYGEGVAAAVREMAASLEEKLVLGDDALVTPAFTAEDEGLQSTCAACNALVSHDVSLVWDEGEVARLDALQLHEWVILGEDGTVSLDEGALRDWMDESCSDAVWHQDDLHVYALDLDQAMDDVLATLSGEAGEATLELASEVARNKPPLSEGADSRGRHLDVNLTTQYARFYDGSGHIIWESYIVSGNLATGHDTPTGDFSILSKQRSRTLVGADEDGDGEPDYYSYVEYWMLFRSGGYGLHDASWRSEFGGNIYTYDGSHGCVNLPPARAAELYGIVNVGDRVYVHW